LSAIENVDPIPNEMFEYCFIYGEKQWHEGKTWEAVKKIALDLAKVDETKRAASCP